MGKLKTLLSALAENPIYAIGVLVAVALLIFGLYVGSPWYVGGARTAIGAVFDTQLARTIVGVLYVVPAASVLIGIKQKSLRRFGTFGVFLMYLFGALLRVISIGFTPMIWIFMLTLGLVSGVVYLYVSLREDEEKVPDDHGLL